MINSSDEARHAEAKEGLRQALRAGQEVLQGGGSALDAVQAAVVAMEDHPSFNAGDLCRPAEDPCISLGGCPANLWMDSLKIRRGALCRSVGPACKSGGDSLQMYWWLLQITEGQCLWHALMLHP